MGSNRNQKTYEGNENVSFLFIHGAGGTKSKWRRLKGELHGVDARFIDLPGRGEAEPDGSHPVSGSIEDFAGYVRQFIPQDVILIGHSMGGLVAMEAAINNHRVKGLVFLGSHYYLPVHPKALARLEKGFFPNGLFYSSYSKKVNNDLLEEEKAELNLVTMKQTYNDFFACNAYTKGRERFAEITCPIQVIVGEDERLLPNVDRDLMYEVNPNVTFRSVAGAGHYVMLEKPRDVSMALLEFRNNVMKKEEV